MHDVSYLLNELNDQQREAVSAAPGHRLVLAGAGSGKTRVLTHRIAWLIEVESLSPFAILAVTFTNKAAAEMRTRIETLRGVPTSGMWVGTFHSIAHRLLRAHWRETGLDQQFQIIDSNDQYHLLRRVLKELGIEENRFPVKQAQWYINDKKDHGLRPEHIETHSDAFARTMMKIYSAYELACRRASLVDFAELLLRSHELWLTNPALLQHYQQRFQAILVDEFQDTNSLQYVWLRLLAGKDTPLMLVGDDDQSIYGWRGAKIENILRFTQDYPGAETTRLEQNYRSTGNILTAANALINHNGARLGKDLWTSSSKGDAISLYAAFNEIDEARFIISRIQAWFNDGHSYSATAILYRSNAQSRVLEEALLQHNIPYRIYGGQRFFERAEIKDALAYLRLMANREDDAAFERVINLPARSIGERTMEIIRHHAREQQLSMWESARQITTEKTEQNILSTRANNAIKFFLQLLNNIDTNTRELELHEQTEYVIQASGLYAHYQKEYGEKAKMRLENLAELVTATRQFDRSESEASENMTTLQAFLSHAALEAGEAQADAFSDCVQLMTLHAAKGLEFPLVFISGMEEGLFPQERSLDASGRLEEERRLCYVGITRAMKKLYLSYAETRRLYGREVYHRASRFIKELPDTVLEEIRMKATVTRSLYTKGKASISTSADKDQPFKLGSVVTHQKFGQGVVLNYEGQGSYSRVQVNFKSNGTKWLMLTHARLQSKG